MVIIRRIVIKAQCNIVSIMPSTQIPAQGYINKDWQSLVGLESVCFEGRVNTKWTIGELVIDNSEISLTLVAKEDKP